MNSKMQLIQCWNGFLVLLLIGLVAALPTQVEDNDLLEPASGMKVTIADDYSNEEIDDEAALKETEDQQKMDPASIKNMGIEENVEQEVQQDMARKMENTPNVIEGEEKSEEELKKDNVQQEMKQDEVELGKSKPTEFINDEVVTSNDQSSSNWMTAVMFAPNGNSIDLNIGQAAFNKAFRRCPVVRYLFKGKLHSVYVRTSSIPSTFDAYNLFTHTWTSKNNLLNKDFHIYSSLADAMANRKPWTYCNYDDKTVGYPRDCGKTGYVPSQWFSVVHKYHKAKSGFSIYTGSNCPSAVGRKMGSWKLQSKKVCYGSKGDTPGEFKLLQDGFLIGIRLVHKSGYLTCGGGHLATHTRWGCLWSYKFMTVIADGDKNIIFPNSNIWRNAYLAHGKMINGAYNMIGFDVMRGKSLTLVDVKSPVYLDKGTKLYVWEGEDLTNKWEGDNSGRHCVEVWAKFRKAA